MGLRSTRHIRQPCRPNTAAAVAPASPASTITMSLKLATEDSNGEGRLCLRELSPELRNRLAPKIFTGFAEKLIQTVIERLNVTATLKKRTSTWHEVGRM